MKLKVTHSEKSCGNFSKLIEGEYKGHKVENYIIISDRNCDGNFIYQMGFAYYNPTMYGTESRTEHYEMFEDENGFVFTINDKVFIYNVKHLNYAYNKFAIEAMKIIIDKYWK